MSWGAVIVGGATLIGAGISSSASSKAASQAGAGAMSAANTEAEAMRDAAEISAEAQVRAAEIMAESTGKSIDEIRRQFDITDQQFEMYRQAGTVGLAGYYSMLAASPIPSQREAARGIIDQLGGQIKTSRQVPLTEEERAKYYVKQVEDPGVPPPIPIGRGQAGHENWKSEMGEWNIAHGLPYNAGYDIAMSKYNEQKTESQAEPMYTGPEYKTVEDVYDIPEITPIEFEESEGYKFQLSEGLKAIENAYSGKMKGQTGKDLLAYSQGLASTEYDKFLTQYYQSLSPFQNLYGGGQAATAQTAQAGSDASSQIASLYQALGQNQAQSLLTSAQQQAGYLGQGASAEAAGLRSASGYQAQNTLNQSNILGSALQQGAGIYGAYKSGYFNDPSALSNWGYI